MGNLLITSHLRCLNIIPLSLSWSSLILASWVDIGKFKVSMKREVTMHEVVHQFHVAEFYSQFWSLLCYHKFHNISSVSLLVNQLCNCFKEPTRISSHCNMQLSHSQSLLTTHINSYNTPTLISYSSILSSHLLCKIINKSILKKWEHGLENIPNSYT